MVEGIVKKIVELVVAALVQEIVSRAFSLVLTNHEEKADQVSLMERLERAHDDLNFALERTRMMPLAVGGWRKKLGDVYKECDDLLSEHKARLPQDQEQVVPRSSSLRRKIMHSVVPSFVVPSMDLLSSSAVRRFEWFAEKADKFVRDVETGCSLAHYRFINPLVRHLQKGKVLRYKMVQGSQTAWIVASHAENNGVWALLEFECTDRKKPMKFFKLWLILPLSESTDIFGVTVKCLQLLGPEFKSLTEFARGQLTQVSTENVVPEHPSPREISNPLLSTLAEVLHPDPVCCTKNGFKPCPNKVLSSELTGRFLEQVTMVLFKCHISASEWCLQSSIDEEHINTMKDWQLSAFFAPHFNALEGCGPLRRESLSPQNCSLHQTMEMVVPILATRCLSLQPEQTKYGMPWSSTHGLATFTVQKPIAEKGSVPRNIGDGSKTRNGTKRKRQKVRLQSSK